MGLIKSSNAPASLSPFSMRDIEMQARAILEKARQQADTLLAAAQTAAESLKVEARAEGLEQGRLEGQAAGTEAGKEAGAAQALAEHQSALSAAFATLKAAVHNLEAQRVDLETTALSEVVELAIAVARRVTKRQGLIDPAVLTANLEEAMKVVVHSADVRIALHPDQKRTLDEALPKLRLQWPEVHHVELIEDGSICPGGCRVHCGQGEVSADLEGQLDRVVEDLLPAGTEALA